MSCSSQQASHLNHLSFFNLSFVHHPHLYLSVQWACGSTQFPGRGQFFLFVLESQAPECLLVLLLVPRWMKRSSQVFIKLTFSLFDLNLPLLEPEVSKAFAGFFVSNHMGSYRVS